jgi:HSP20 family protein
MVQKAVKTQGAEARQDAPATVTTGSAAERTRARAVYTPRTDIYETETGLVVLVELPGVRPEDAEVILEKNVLTIRGHTREHAPEGFSPIYREYETGDFERAFTLSDELDGQRIEASAEGGVLRLFLPKVGPAESKRIEVRAG